MSVRSMKMLALCLGLAACTDGTSVQVITGRVDTAKGALAVRAVSDGEVITATPVRTDGSFTLTLPAGTTYRLEVLTQSGVKNIVKRTGNVLRDLSFKVCEPTDPFDVGGVGDPTTDGLCMPGDPNCKPCDPATGVGCEQPPLPPTCDPMDPSCACDIVAPDGTCCQAGDPSCGPLPCMDPADPTCCANGFCPPPKCDPMDPTCEPPPPPTCSPGDPNCCEPDAAGNCPPPPPCSEPPCDPMDPTCQPNPGGCEPPPGCDPMSPNGCEPPPPPPGCDPMSPNGCEPPPPPGCDPMSPNGPNGCEPPGCDPMSPAGCEPCADANAPGCAPPCEDPMDPTTCKDPCADDPASCGCMVDASGEANCWPEPQTCCNDAAGTTCDPTDGLSPDNVPGDFGCEGP